MLKLTEKPKNIVMYVLLSLNKHVGKNMEKLKQPPKKINNSRVADLEIFLGNVPSCGSISRTAVSNSIIWAAS